MGLSQVVLAKDYKNKSFPLSLEFPDSPVVSSFETDSGLVTRVQVLEDNALYRLDYSMPKETLNKGKTEKMLESIQKTLSQKVSVSAETQIFAKGYQGKQWEYEYTVNGQKHYGVWQTFVNQKKWVSLKVESTKKLPENDRQKFLDSLNLK